MKSSELSFNRDVISVIRSAIGTMHNFPESRAALTGALAHMPAAARRRGTWRRKDVVVPPLLIVSTTEKCNLNCAGCYAKDTVAAGKEATRAQIDVLLGQAADAGCSVILLAGGEPLLSMHWLSAVASRPEFLGLVFTNGTLLDDEAARWFADNRNMIPLLSVEGNSRMTDARRGAGVAGLVEKAVGLLSQRNIPLGLSVTTGEHNIDEVARYSFISPFVESGGFLFIFTEYVPVDDSAPLYILSEESKKRLQTFCLETSKENKLISLSFPGDESKFDGCLAAGRGFAHISASGSLEPCPFAPASDRNVFETSLIDALSSPLFKRIRSESHLLRENAGGCALRGRV